VTSLHKIILSLLVIGASGGFFCQPAQATVALDNRDSIDLSLQLPLAAPAGPIVGNITFAGRVTLDSGSVNTATMVQTWSGNSTTPTAGLPQVASRNGTFTSFVTAGDGTLFQPNWSFNSGAVTNFWSVDGFQFDLASSSILSQTGNGFLVVTGTGTVSGNGFLATPGSWSFTTQDPAANGQFSFSGSTAAVPESSTVVFLAMGGLGMACLNFFRKKNGKRSGHPPFSLATWPGFTRQ
jgi:hypothetical protein